EIRLRHHEQPGTEIDGVTAGGATTRRRSAAGRAACRQGGPQGCKHRELLHSHQGVGLEVFPVLIHTRRPSAEPAYAILWFVAPEVRFSPWRESEIVGIDDWSAG